LIIPDYKETNGFNIKLKKKKQGNGEKRLDVKQASGQETRFF
jgi:hypothetical protein